MCKSIERNILIKKKLREIKKIIKNITRDVNKLKLIIKR